jgi:hypothetical protein
MPALTMGPSRPWRFPGGMLAFSQAWNVVEVMPAVDIPRKGNAGALHAHSAREHGTRNHRRARLFGGSRVEDKRPGVVFGLNVLTEDSDTRPDSEQNDSRPFNFFSPRPYVQPAVANKLDPLRSPP